MLDNNLLPPTFESSRRPDQFVATFLFHHFLVPRDLAWLRRLTRDALSDEEARALVFVRELGAIDNAAYRAINRTDTLDASTHLRRLRDQGLLEMKGSGSRTYYVPSAVFIAERDEPADGNEHQSDSDKHHLSPDSHHLSQNSHHLLVTIPPDLRPRLPAAGSKPRRAGLRDLLIDLCRWRPPQSAGTGGYSAATGSQTLGA